MIVLAMWLWLQLASSLTVRPHVGIAPLAVQVNYRVTDVNAADEAIEVVLWENGEPPIALRRSERSLDIDDSRAIMVLQWENVGAGEYTITGCVLPANRCLTKQLIVK